MTENLIAAGSAIVALVGLVLTYQGYRDKQKQGRREHASMLNVCVYTERSQLHDRWEIAQVVVSNRSNQLYHEVRVRYRDQTVAETATLSASQTWQLPPSENSQSADLLLSHITVEFNDAEGTRWRREGSGRLRRGRQTKTGDWEWDAPEPPLITAAEPSDDSWAGPGRAGRPPRPSAPLNLDHPDQPGTVSAPNAGVSRLRRVPPVLAASVSVVLLIIAALLILVK
ncbi:hypothetical protein ACFQ8S_03575 [Streptomyces virginiae]|uniref:hypothetical protein n=1 Tax=Streptomyces virginiae TaxID=1961 RepID=UPI0036C2FF46